MATEQDGEAEGQATEQQTDDSPETVQLAREMGWKPETEWRGEPPKGGFTTATDFIRRGEKILPIVNARARKAEERASQLEAKLERMEHDHRETVQRIERMSSTALALQRTQIESQYAARKEAAVEVGDKDAYRLAVKDENEANKALDERLKEPEGSKRQAAPELPKAARDTIEGWMGENPWFNSDPELNAIANIHHVQLTQTKPGMTLAENLAAVRAHVKRRAPEKFAAANEDAENDDDERPARRGSPVEGGSRIAGGGGRSLYSKLPADARAQADRFIKDDGLFLEKGETAAKNMAQARERYAEKYLGDQA